MFSSSCSRLAAFLLAFFFGWLGAHRFYVGKYWTGLFQLLTAGGFGIWWVVDAIFILAGIFTDSDGRRLVKW